VLGHLMAIKDIADREADFGFASQRIADAANPFTDRR